MLHLDVATMLHLNVSMLLQHRGATLNKYKRSPYVSCHDPIFSFFRSLPARLLFLSRLYFISGLSRVFSPLKDLAMILFFLEPVFPYTTICLFSRYAFVQCCTSMLQQCCTSMFRCCCNIEVQHWTNAYLLYSFWPSGKNKWVLNQILIDSNSGHTKLIIGRGPNVCGW